MLLFKTDSDHENDESEPAGGLPADMKAFIRNKFEEGIQKPNAVLYAIQSGNMTEPLKGQLSLPTYLQQLQTKKYDQATVISQHVCACPT